MTETEQKNLKTPSYLRKAIDDYTTRNIETIKERQRKYYHSLTPEQKEQRYTKIKALRLLKKQQLQTKPNTTTDIANTYKSKYSLLTPEQKEAYKAKQRENYQKRKLQKLEQNNEQNNIVYIPIDNLKIE
jgi:hypothetical protein